MPSPGVHSSCGDEAPRGDTAPAPIWTPISCDVFDRSQSVRGAWRVQEIDPDVPHGIFQSLVADFCSTVTALAIRLDLRLEQSSRARGQRIAPPTNERQDMPTSSEWSIPNANATPVSTSVKETQEPGGDRLNSLSVQEAREALGPMGLNQHLVHKADAEEVAARFRRHRHLFTDVEAMKDQIRHTILKPYNVSNFYHIDGFCSRIATNSTFENITLGVVALSSLWIAVDADVNTGLATKDKDIFFQLVDYSIFVFFLGEWLIRFGAFEDKLNSLKDFWFCFDTVLVLSMIMDVSIPLFLDKGLGFNPSIIRLARLVRISRMARIAKLLNKWPELSVLIKGVGIGARSVFSTFMLLVIVVYVFAVAFRFLTAEEEAGDVYFSSVLLGMKFLILFSTVPDSVDFITELGSDGNVINGLLAFLFISITSLTLLNMLIGILCEVIGVVASVEKETARVQMVKDHLLLVLSDVDLNLELDDTLVITKADFQTLLVKPSVAKLLHEIGVDPIGLIDFIDYIFSSDLVAANQHGLTFDKLVQLIVDLGGKNTATVKDIIDMRQVVLRQMTRIESSLAEHFRSSASSSKPSCSLPYEKEKCAVLPMRALSPEEINCFLEMVASSWIASVGSHGNMLDSTKEEKAAMSSSDDRDFYALEGKFGELDKLSQKVLELEKIVNVKHGDAGDSKITSLAFLVSDLQSRLSKSQDEVKQANEQLSHITRATQMLEAKANSARVATNGWDLRADFLETEFENLSRRTGVAEETLKKLQSAQNQSGAISSVRESCSPSTNSDIAPPLSSLGELRSPSMKRDLVPPASGTASPLKELQTPSTNRSTSPAEEMIVTDVFNTRLALERTLRTQESAGASKRNCMSCS